MVRRFLIAGGAVAVLAVLIGVSLVQFHAPRAQAGTTWVATATQGLSLVNATSLGALPDTTPLHIVVALKVSNMTALNQYIQSINDPSSAEYGAALTPDQFVASYAPSAAAVSSVESYLTSQGFTNIQAEANDLFVTADGTAAQASTAFNTQLGQFTQFGQTVYANTTAAEVPSSLGDTVLAVLGLNDAGRFKAGPALPSTPQYLVSYGPRDFWKAYDATKAPTGAKTAIAIFAEGDLSGVVKDLRTEEAAYSLPQVPYSIVQVGLASPDTSGADEWDLDTQYSTGMADTVAHLYIYDTTSLTDSDIALEFSRFASQDVAKAGSASFGECETFPYLDGSMLADDEVFAEAAAQGQTVFASSGDTGGACAVAPTNGVPSSGAPNVEYPAASPYVVGVGGTTLLTNSDGTYDNEIAWNAGGGGTSIWEISPYWQSGFVPGSTAGKGVPDIAMDADPESGANVYVNGSPLVVGGTSLSSPLSLGVWARLESGHGNKLGNAGPALYHLYAKYPTPQTAQVPTSATGFHDIIAGTNGTWVATPGWDYTTGLGTFDVAVMNGLI
jgi:pseudomonalisin